MLITEPTGRWLVQTYTSIYVLDLDEMTCLRYPGMGTGHEEHPSMYYTAELRRDAEAIPMLSYGVVQIDEPMFLCLDLRGDGVPTVRMTTPVRSCERVTGEIHV